MHLFKASSPQKKGCNIISPSQIKKKISINSPSFNKNSFYSLSKSVSPTNMRNSCNKLILKEYEYRRNCENCRLKNTLLNTNSNINKSISTRFNLKKTEPKFGLIYKKRLRNNSHNTMQFIQQRLTNTPQENETAENFDSIKNNRNWDTDSKRSRNKLILTSYNFEAKFINHLPNQTDSSLETTEESITEEVSYSEEIVESDDTVYSTSSEDSSSEEIIESESETESQMQRRLSAILSNLHFTQESMLDLSSESVHICNESIQMEQNFKMNCSFQLSKHLYFSMCESSYKRSPNFS